MTDIEHLLAERAAAMAAHDGVPVGVVHLHGAANQLQTDLFRARGDLIRGLQSPKAEPVGGAPVEAAEAASIRGPARNRARKKTS